MVDEQKPELSRATFSELKKKSKDLRPLLNVGKNGLNQAVFDQMSVLLKSKRLVKVKFLRSAVGDVTPQQMSIQITRRCHCYLIDQIGLVATFYR